MKDESSEVCCYNHNFNCCKVISENFENKTKQTKNCPCSLYLISPIYKLLPACPFTLSKNAPCIKTADVCQIESANPILTALQSLSSHLKCKEVLN